MNEQARPQKVRLLRVKQAAEIRSVGVATIYVWIHNEENPLPAVRAFEAIYLIREDDLAAYEPRRRGRPQRPEDESEPETKKAA